jgi:hypothetical protein
MEHDGLVEAARTALVARYGSMWEAACAMRIGLSGGQLLLAMRREQVDPAIAAVVEVHTGVSLPCAKAVRAPLVVNDLGVPHERERPRPKRGRR